MQIDRSNVTCGAGKVDDVLNNESGQTFAAIIGMHDDAFNIANLSGGIGGRQHEFSFSSGDPLYLSQKDEGLFVR